MASMRRGLSSLVVAALLVGSRAAAAPHIDKGPWPQRITRTTAEIRLELSEPAPVVLELEGDGGKGTSRKFQSREAKTFHVVRLEGLTPSTVYSLSVVAGPSRLSGGFTTAPPDDSAAPFRFLVYGDNRTDDASHAQVVRAMASIPADFILHTGDFVEDGGDARQWQTFFDIEAPLLRRTCVFAAVGNHELLDQSATYFLRYFALGPPDVWRGAEPAPGTPLLSGTFRWASARFFVFNAMSRFTEGADRAWLERVLNEADGEAGLVWRVIVAHHGPWSAGPHGDNRALLEAGIPDLFRKHKVNLVLAGHDHIYERGEKGGLPYLVSGGGGAPAYEVKHVRAQTKKAEAVRHFVEVTATRDGLAIVARRMDGSLLETCGLPVDKAAWDCDAPPAAPPAAPPTIAPPAATPRSSCACDLAGQEGSRGAPGLFALSVLFALAVRRACSSR